MNQPAHRAGDAVASNPATNGQPLPLLPGMSNPTISSLAGLPARSRPNEISQLVWNSVLESLNTGMHAATKTPGAADVPVTDPSGADPAGAGASPSLPAQVAAPAQTAAAEAPVAHARPEPQAQPDAHPQLAPQAAARAGFTPQPLYPQPLYTAPASGGDLDQQGIADLFAPAQASLAELVANPAPMPPSALYDLPSGERNIYVPNVTPASIPVVVIPSNTGVHHTGAVPRTTGAVPRTNLTGSGMIVPAIPVLSQPSRVAAPPRPQPNRHIDPTPVVARMAPQKKRHPFRAVFGLLVVLALIGGAAYAGWYFLIRAKVTWSAEDAPVAKFVESTVHRRFTKSVPMVTLSAPEYEVKLGLAIEDDLYPDADGQISALRAVGVASANQSPSIIGHWAAAAITSFYRPDDKTIYRMKGDTSVFQLSLLRSMTMALADQNLSWFKAWPTLTDAQRVGYMAELDGVAHVVVKAKFVVDPQLEGQSSAELTSRSSAAGFSDKGLPIAVAAVIASHTVGLPRLPAPPADDPFKGLAPPPSDAAVFDPARDPSLLPIATGNPVPDATAQRMFGMQFWYEAMAPAIGPAAARTAALAWAGEASVVTLTTGRPCITSNITARTDADEATLMAGLQALVTSRPASSNASVRSTADVITISMCEPTEGATDQLVAADADYLYSSAQTEVSFGTDLVAIGLPVTAPAWQCAINAKRAGSVKDYIPGSTDPTQAAQENDVITFCRAAVSTVTTTSGTPGSTTAPATPGATTATTTVVVGAQPAPTTALPTPNG